MRRSIRNIRRMSGGDSYKWNFSNRVWALGSVPTEGPDYDNVLLAGAGSSFDSDAANPNGWTLDAAGDEIWIDADTTGTRICGGGVNAGFRVQQIEYESGVLLKIWGEACTYFRCDTSHTDISGELDVSNLSSTLTYLRCNTNSITTLNVSTLTSLTNLTCHANSISILDVSSLINLTYLSCYSNTISILDVSSLTSLTTLQCRTNSISILDVSALTSLATLYCYSNTISILDVSSLTSLTNVRCYSNTIATLDISALTSLTTLQCQDNLMVTAAVDTIIEDLFDTVVTNPRIGTVLANGTNDAVTGTYQEPIDHGNPANAAEAAWVLVNDDGWTVSINTV